MVNKFYYIKGGSETYYFALKRLLESKGHEVIDFSMKDEKNFESPYRDYFVDGVDYNGTMGIKEKIRSAMNIINSKEAARKIEALILATHPDVCHLHIFQHQLSPSILGVLKKYNIPTVYTAHDLKMLCLNYVMMNNKGQVCEKCKGGKYMNCLAQKCVKNSTAKSAICVIEGYLHKWKKSYDQIDRILTPSKFYYNKFIEFGIQQSRVMHLPNFLDREKPIINHRDDKEQYFLYFGRLSREKGIMTLIRALEGTNQKLYIVGSGPCKEMIESYVTESKLEEQVSILGFKSGQELLDIIGNAKAVVMPSEWYENGPYSAIESLQLGRPIIGSDLGGIPELVEGNGYIFPNGNVEVLRKVIENFPDSNTLEYQNLCKRSEEIFRDVYMKETHYDRLLNVYTEIIQNRRK